jgi:hypothetical protein
MSGSLFSQLCSGRAGRRPLGGLLLPPSGEPTQVGTTPGVSFRAVIRADGEENVEAAL